jgi:hypothetical protein
MTQQEITQLRNEQIALMLDWEQYQNSEERWFGHWKPSTTLASMIEKPWSIRVERLEFDSDWNWLMEAIQFLQNHFESKEMVWTAIERYPLYTDIDTAFILVSYYAKLYNEGKL